MGLTGCTFYFKKALSLSTTNIISGTHRLKVTLVGVPHNWLVLVGGEHERDGEEGDARVQTDVLGVYKQPRPILHSSSPELKEQPS